ncbi:hypothetical protein FHS23_002551 [Prauserella isguenensis]|uniref:Uncharacterized protein n=1 Tax=Prauserella isguenensis TaxID=1470180 RepID=A0A839S135_9PSEU|nr:hypothetical protein [Prauserella isguenensis]
MTRVAGGVSTTSLSTVDGPAEPPCVNLEVGVS